jgi:hypothetical protein
MLISEWSDLEQIQVGIPLGLEVCKIYKKLSVSLGPSVERGIKSALGSPFKPLLQLLNPSLESSDHGYLLPVLSIMDIPIFHY